MDNLRTLENLLLAFVLYQGLVDGLIGLRPPDQTPHKDNDKKLPRQVSPKPTHVHRTQLYSPYTNPDAKHNTRVIETERVEDRDRCQTLELLRCSSQLLRYSLLNRTDVCRDIQHFTTCILGPLREYGRRECITGMVILNDLHFAVRERFRCLGNASSITHLRHRIAKRHGGVCCTEGVMNCVIQTFFKMTANIKESCDLVNFYDVCMLEVSESCQLKNLSTLYPVFVSQMKRHCKGTSKRRKRLNLLNDIFSDSS